MPLRNATRPVPAVMLGPRRYPSRVPVVSPFSQHGGAHAPARMVVQGNFEYPVAYSRPLVSWGHTGGMVPRRVELGIGAKSSRQTYGWPWSFQGLRISPPQPMQSYLYRRMVSPQFSGSPYSFQSRNAARGNIPAPRVPLTQRTFGRILFPWGQ